MNRSSKPKLEIGRIELNYPKPGHLDVYEKSDGSIGATFSSEADAGRYGVTAGVLDMFENLGTYAGWGYADEARTLVFRFVLGADASAPEHLIAIRTPDGRVDLPPNARERGVEYADGALVAFYLRLVRSEVSGRLKRVATSAFAVRPDRFGVIARVVACGRLRFPECEEVLTMFLDGLSEPSNRDPKNSSLITMALDRAAADPKIPGRYRTSARVERSRNVGGLPAAEEDRGNRRGARDQEANSQISPKRLGTAGAVKNGIVTGVMRSDLRAPGE